MDEPLISRYLKKMVVPLLLFVRTTICVLPWMQCAAVTTQTRVQNARGAYCYKNPEQSTLIEEVSSAWLSDDAHHPNATVARFTFANGSFTLCPFRVTSVLAWTETKLIKKNAITVRTTRGFGAGPSEVFVHQLGGDHRGGEPNDVCAGIRLFRTAGGLCRCRRIGTAGDSPGVRSGYGPRLWRGEPAGGGRDS